MDVYVYDADLYCEECGKAIAARCDPEKAHTGTYPQGPYGNGGGEADTPWHCASCGVFLENPLTCDGVAYVREALADNTGRPEVLSEWRTFYAI